MKRYTVEMWEPGKSNFVEPDYDILADAEKAALQAQTDGYIDVIIYARHWHKEYYEEFPNSWRWELDNNDVLEVI